MAPVGGPGPSLRTGYPIRSRRAALRALCIALKMSVPVDRIELDFDH